MDRKIKQIVPATPGFQLVEFHLSNPAGGASTIQIRATPVLLWALCTDDENPDGMVHALAPFHPDDGGSTYMYVRDDAVLCHPGGDPDDFAIEAERAALTVEVLRKDGKRLEILDTKGNPIARQLPLAP